MFLLILHWFYRCLVKVEFGHVGMNFGRNSSDSVLSLVKQNINNSDHGGCNCDPRLAFKAKVDSHETTSWRHDLGGSPRAKIMKFHDVNFPLFSLLILILLVFLRALNRWF